MTHKDVYVTDKKKEILKQININLLQSSGFFVYL
jgi:hypothetical protein